MTVTLPATFDRILVIRRDNIGDLLCTTPMLHALRRRYPSAHIAVLANSYNAPVLANNPDVDRVHAYTKAKHADTLRPLCWWREWRLYRALRAGRFDLIIHANPVPHPRTARLVRYLRAPYRLGVTLGDDRAYNIAVHPDAIPRAHHVVQVQALLTPLGITDRPGPMTLVPSLTDHPDRRAHSIRIGVHLSSRKPCNRWPAASYEHLIGHLLDSGMGVTLLWAPGSQKDPRHPGDDEFAETLGRRFGERIELAPTVSLEDLINRIAGVDLMVCPDGGAMHIAAALRKPTVALFGCTDAHTWGPWQVTHETLEGRGSAANISPERVVAAVQALAEQP